MNGIEVLEREVVFHRYYDPATGQFLSVDPLVATTGQPYAYADDNPVNGTDPLGMITGGYCPPGDCPTIAGTNDPIQSAPSGFKVGSSGDTTWNGGMNYSPTASQSAASVSPTSAPIMMQPGLLNILNSPPAPRARPTPPNLFQWIWGFVARNYKAIATVAAGVVCISGLGTVICVTAGGRRHRGRAVI